MLGSLKRLAVPAIGIALGSFMVPAAQASSLPYLVGSGPISDGSADLAGLGSAIAATGVESYTLTDIANKVVGTGTLEESVYADPNNMFGKGDLTFVVKIDSVTSGDVGRITLSDFSNASQFDIAATGSGVGAGEVSLVSGGAGVAIDFGATTNSKGITTGGSQTFLLQTDGKYFAPGSISVIDTGDGKAAGFGVGVAPLPATASMGLALLGGLGALGGVNALRRSRRTA